MKNILIVILALSLFGCAKNRDVELVREPDTRDVLLKNAFFNANERGERATWLTKVTVIDTSDSPAGTLFVGYQGNVQAGYFDFTQNQLQFKSLTGKLQGVESENLKNSVLMNWNIDHIDYTLDERDGQTTNQQIVDNFKTWDQKRFFRINWSEQKEVANSMNMFPISSFAFFSCWQPSNIRRVENSMKVEPDHIGFNIEVVYTRQPACGSGSQWNQGDFNFTATFKYSFRKLEDTGYQPKFYTNEQAPERYKYGHFQTVRQVINPKNGRPQNLFMENRWAEKTQHFYYVKGFPEKYKWIWNHEDPKSVFGQTNALLESVGSKLRFEIHEYNYNHDTQENNGPEREFGDLRYSFINFIEELEAGGTPLGYGPSDTNPFTGEILAANSMVWTGSLGFYTELMESVGKEVEDDKGQPKESSLFSQLRAALQTPSEQNVNLANYTTRWKQTEGVGRVFKRMAQATRFGLPFWNSYTADELGQISIPTYVEKYNDGSKFKNGTDFLDFASVIEQVPFNESSVNLVELSTIQGKLNYINPTDVLDISWMEKLVDQSPVNNGFSQFVKVLQNLNKVTNRNYQGPGGFKTISEQHFRHQHANIEANKQGHCIMDFDEFAGGLAGFLQASKIDLSNPKVREDFLNTVLYRVSIHEFGHNLNLRHNFYGSVDVENFGLNSDAHSIAKFQVKDKAGNVLKESNTNKVLEVQNGVLVEAAEPAFGPVRTQVSSSVMDYLRLEDEINTPWAWEEYDVAAIRDSYEPGLFDDKGQLYLYCTDEHTATSAICNRHDLGTTPSEILMSQIRSYDERYELRNKRFGRAVWNTAGYANGVFGTMMSMKEFLPFWRTALAEDLIKKEMEALQIPQEEHDAYIEEINREMRKVMKLSMAFYQAVLQQSRGDRDFRSKYDETTGALKQVGIISDKIFAMMFLTGDDAIYYNPNRIMNHNSYLTYSNAPKLGEFTERIWRNMITSRNIAMEPWFINFARFLYAKNATNFSNRGAAGLIDALKIVKVDTALELEQIYGITMDPSLPAKETVVTKAPTSTKTFKIDEKVVVVEVDGSYYISPVTKGHVTYALFQDALDVLTGNGDDEDSLTQFRMDVRELHWLYTMASGGNLQ